MSDTKTQDEDGDHRQEIRVLQTKIQFLQLKLTNSKNRYENELNRQAGQIRHWKTIADRITPAQALAQVDVDHAQKTEEETPEAKAEAKKEAQNLAICHELKKASIAVEINVGVLGLVAAALRGEDQGEGEEEGEEEAEGNKLMESYVKMNSPSTCLTTIPELHKLFLSLLKKGLKVMLNADNAECKITADNLEAALGPGKSTSSLVKAANEHAKTKGYQNMRNQWPACKF